MLGRYKKGGGEKMFLLSAITAGASLGSIIGGAIATIAGTSVATGTAVGSIAGAGLGLVACVAEPEEDY